MYSTIFLGIVLVFFGILFILLMVYVIQVNKAKENSKGKSSIMPPLEYMQQEGVRCPDYWVYMGADPTRKGYHICQNKFNIPVSNADNTVCYTDKNAKTRSFRDVSIDNKGVFSDAEAEKDMCMFVSQCGPSSGMTASWLGVSSEQMSAGYANCGKV